LAPLVRGKKGEFQKELKKLQKEGFARARIDGEIRDLAEEIILEKINATILILLLTV